MCHETGAGPPLPPIAGGSGGASSQHLILEATDGNRLRAFSATAIDPEATGIVILSDVRGLHLFYERLAVRFAETGVHATAIDYFGRTAGIDDRGEDFDFMAHRRRVTAEGMAADIAAGDRTHPLRLGRPRRACVHARLLHGRADLVRPGGRPT